MKLFILAATLFLGLNAMATTGNPNVNEKVLKTFNQVFSNAQNVQWNTTAEYSEASFSAGAVTSRAMFDNNGKLIRTIRYYNEKHLPSNIVYKVKNKYEGKDIYGVTEMTSPVGISYSIVLRDSKNIYNVAVDNDGVVTLTNKYKRGDI